MPPADEQPTRDEPASSAPSTPGAGQPTTGQAPSPTAALALPVGRPAPVERQPNITPVPRASDADRNAIAERLRDAFADGRLDEDEFDVRMQTALSARTLTDLEGLLADLVPAGSPPPAPVPLAPAPGPVVGGGSGPVHSLNVAIFSGVDRRGRWRVPEESTSVAIMGGISLDLRAASFSAQVTTMRVVAIMGGVDIKVPPGVRVEMNGIPFMGGADLKVDDDNLPTTAPLLRIHYFAMMGGVSVSSRQSTTELVKERLREQLERPPSHGVRDERHQLRHELRDRRHEYRRGQDA